MHPVVLSYAFGLERVECARTHTHGKMWVPFFQIAPMPPKLGGAKHCTHAPPAPGASVDGCKYIYE